MTRAVVFAYHDVGVRGLRTLLAHGVDVPLVVTHADAPGETIWFDSVERHAHWHRLTVRTPADANEPHFIAEVAAARPDFLFSFYYRQLLCPRLLALAPRGAYNLHGSLLPRYRGRAPVNWAVLNGETRTGATLHAMTAAPDAGAIVASEAVPILPDDTAVEVFRKVTVAAERVLDGALPALLAGRAPHLPQRAQEASYFGARSARDGAIDWRRGMLAAHNLIRAVAPPYPGAFSRAAGLPLAIWRSLPGPTALTASTASTDVIGGSTVPSAARPLLCWRDGEVQALCHDGALRLLDFRLGEHVGDAEAFHREYGASALALEPFLESA